MRLILVLFGMTLLATTWYDMARTVFDVGRGAGPVTGQVSAQLWRGCLWLRRRGMTHRALETFGIAIVLSVVATWLVGVWMGWTLIFAGDADALVDTATRRPASFWERAYFLGGGVFSLSNGEFTGGSTAWRLGVASTVASGLLVVTLSITYLVPVLDAATERRHVAALVSSLGSTPQEILLATWDGSGWHELHDHLVTLLPMLTSLGQRHLAYPVLHFFHSSSRRTAIAPSIAALDEALVIFEQGLAGGSRAPSSVRAARRAIEEFLPKLQLYPGLGESAPAPPRLDVLRAHGVRTVPDDRFAAALDRGSQRRRLLLATVREDGWDWDDVLGHEAVEGDHSAAISRTDGRGTGDPPPDTDTP